MPRNREIAIDRDYGLIDAFRCDFHNLFRGQWLSLYKVPATGRQSRPVL